MVNQSTPIGFSLQDLLTRVIPGSVTLAPAISGLYLFEPNLFPSSNMLLISFGLTEFLIGTLIDQVRTGIFGVPFEFQFFIYKETDNQSKLPWRHRKILKIQNTLPDWIPKYYQYTETDSYLPNRLDLDFQKSMEDRLGIDFQESNPRDIHDALILYLQPNMSSRTLRQQYLYFFPKNLQIATVGAISLYLFQFAINPSNSIIQIALLFLLGISSIVALIMQIFSTTPALYSDLLLKYTTIVKKLTWWDSPSPELEPK